MAERERGESGRTPCHTCLGAGRVLRWAVMDGRTREVWTTCPTCSGPSAVVKGPD
ncbi:MULTISPECIES: hypothetical protein [Polymorphospora]|uniref:Uncharacterized protein n=2 Tax=Polymorphospora TaxID=338583 RepID=A0A810N3L1_9ACTN|nr:hypothetical protein [Polymorphospora rubra]BCJ67164.1 hypothetical protein Prubr_41850 [Polymorphospora rubra]